MNLKMIAEIVHCTLEDFDQILRDLPDFWGSNRTAPFHHPIFVHEFGNTAYVTRLDGKVAAYLFGFVSPNGNTGYIHLVGVRSAFQGKGLGTGLYKHFAFKCREAGCNELKAITTPGNKASLDFHQRLGFQFFGEKNSEGILVVKDYSGPGQDRVVMEKPL